MPARSRRLVTPCEAGGSQQVAHGLGLVMAVFQQQPAAVAQVGRGLRHDDADVGQAVGAGRQRAQRLVGQRGQMRVVRRPRRADW